MPRVVKTPAQVLEDLSKRAGFVDAVLDLMRQHGFIGGKRGRKPGSKAKAARPTPTAQARPNGPLPRRETRPSADADQ